MRPKVESGGSPSRVPAKARSSGTPKLARFRMLNPSTRSSRRPPLPSAPHRAVFVSDRSSVRRSGPMKSPRPGVAERAGRLQHERRRVEPLVDAAEDGVVRAVAGRVARAILADARAARRLPLRARSVGLHEHRQRVAAAHRPDPRQVPAVEHRAGRAGQPLRERDLPRDVHHPVVPRVEVRRPLVVAGHELGQRRRRAVGRVGEERRGLRGVDALRERVRRLHREAAGSSGAAPRG